MRTVLSSATQRWSPCFVCTDVVISWFMRCHRIGGRDCVICPCCYHWCFPSGTASPVFTGITGCAAIFKATLCNLFLSLKITACDCLVSGNVPALCSERAGWKNYMHVYFNMQVFFSFLQFLLKIALMITSHQAVRYGRAFLIITHP